MVGKDLGRVRHKHTAETNVVGYVVQEYEDDDGICGILIRNTAVGGYLETSQSDGCGGKTGDHTEARRQEELASTKFINKEADTGS